MNSLVTLSTLRDEDNPRWIRDLVSGAAQRYRFWRRSVSGRADDLPMHELIDLTDGVSRNGYPAVVWVCSCGRRGSGSLNVPEAQTGFLKHARGRA